MSLLATLAVIAAAIVPPFGAVAVLIWAQLTGTPWESLGFGRPPSWTLTIVGGLVIGVVLKFVMKIVVLPLLGAPPTNTAYAALVGNLPMLMQLLVVSIVVGGIGEEIFWRGFLFERLRTLLGDGGGAQIAIVLVTAIAFALAHYWDQGITGVEQAIFTGLTFGTLFAMTGVLWPVMVAHAAYDLVAVVLIYSGLEEQVAHLLIR